MDGRHMIDIPGEARSDAEMRFAASLVACSGCGSFDSGPLGLRPSMMGSVILASLCPHCGAERAVRFRVRFKAGRPCVDPDYMPAAHELGGPEPSRVIRPEQLVAQIDRLSPTVIWTPENLAPAAWRRQWDINSRLMTCLNELLKFPGKDTCARIIGERDRLAALIEAYRKEGPRIYAQEQAGSPRFEPRGELNARSVDAHRQWIRRGCTGEGRLDIAHIDASGRRIGYMDLTAARLDHITFDRSNLAFAKFDRAELIDITMIQANLIDCSFAGARLIRCDLLGANLSLGKLDEVEIEGGRFDRSQLDRSLFRRAKVGSASFRGTDFGNAALDDSVFTDCDLRGTSFSLHTRDLLGTMARTRFERCDLRETSWEGRALDTVVFVDCERRQ
jgi:uncharacterized protein YjbI with pentapeptide repeats